MEHDTLIHFLHDFDFRPESDPLMTIAYKAGMEVEVSEECASRAVALGCAMYPAMLEDDLIDGRANDYGDDEA